MRRLLPAVLTLCLVLPAAAGAQEMSANVERVTTVPEMASAISINFIDDTMFVSTVTGVFAYGVADPAAPSLIGALPMPIWENEDVDVDPVRKRLFIARDPRGVPGVPSGTFPLGAVHIIDVSFPHAMTQIGAFTLPAGHTSTCINGCDFLWTGGPVANPQTQPDWVGRPIFATDVTDPANPKQCPEPIDLERNDGVTDYAHDVQVDTRGVAWVSGGGGVRGYWTSGEHRNPLTGKVETATGCQPIPYAGSGTPEEATPSRFMHNSYRETDPNAARKRAGIPLAPAERVMAIKHDMRAESPSPRARASRAGAKRRCSTRRGSRKARRRCAFLKRCDRARARGRRAPKGCPRPRRKQAAPKPAPAPAAPTFDARTRVLYGTEEALQDACTSSGRFVTYDLEGTFDGEGFKDIAKTKHRMKVLDTFTPENQEGATGCASAHYFASRGDGVFANAFYTQGVRFLDVSDPREIRQIGWYRPADADVFAAYWYKGHVFVADFRRGVDVLKFQGSKSSRTVRAPALGATRSELEFDRHFLGGLCPLPAA